MRSRITYREVAHSIEGLTSRAVLACGHRVELRDERTADPGRPIRYVWDGVDEHGEIECPSCASQRQSNEP